MSNQDSAKQDLIMEMVEALEPLAEILSRYGVTSDDFKYMASEAFRRGTSSPGDSGVKAGKHKSVSATFRKREIARLLHFWFTDPEFSDEDCKPARLAFSSGHPNFEELVNKHAPHWKPGEMLKTMVQAGAIDSDESSKFFPTTYSFIPDQQCMMLGVALRNVLRTFAQNSRPDTKPEAKLANRSVHARVPNHMVDEVRRDFRHRLIKFVEQTDREISELEREGAGLAESKTTLLGIGTYVFEG